MNIKRIGKTFLSRQFEKQVMQLRKTNDFTLVAVVGSVGKTTTKLTIAKMLEPQKKVQYQTGNYNDRLTVPLIFFGQQEPGIYNIAGWLKAWRANKRMLKQPYPYDVVVAELGSDGPGQIKDFAYLKPDITVVTALTDEHMAFFKTLDAVAQEELTVLDFSRQTLINVDDSPAKYLENRSYLGYGNAGSDYRIVSRQPQTDGMQTLQLELNGEQLNISTKLMGEQGAKSVVAASAVAKLCGLSNEQIATNAATISAVAGRMQLLKGIKNSTIIDDSYNASPVAMKAALDVLYAQPSTQRIAVLGNMNEMGELSPMMHTDMGEYCNPELLDLVITLGPDANQYLAPAAEAAGCNVKQFTSPYEVGKFLQEYVKEGAAILIKGSQNKVFSEEAIKPLLANPSDASNLVRQSSYWLNVKKKQFNV